MISIIYLCLQTVFLIVTIISTSDRNRSRHLDVHVRPGTHSTHMSIPEMMWLSSQMPFIMKLTTVVIPIMNLQDLGVIRQIQKNVGRHVVFLPVLVNTITSSSYYNYNTVRWPNQYSGSSHLRSNCACSHCFGGTHILEHAMCLYPTTVRALIKWSSLCLLIM